jgi:integrase
VFVCALRTPSYRLHKPTGQAVVTLNGHDIYLGRHGSPESRTEYDRLLAEWLANGRQLLSPAPPGGSDLTVNELLLAYLKFADSYYLKHGKPTTEPASIRVTVRPLRRLYGDTLARDFSPLQLKAVRQAMVDSGLCRNEVNKRTGRVVRLFKWAVGEGLVPPSVHHGLQAVSGLRRGRAEVRESKPVKPVPEAFVDAIRPHVSRQVWAMVELQRLTAMRPGEACIMRSNDLDTSGRVWAYRPSVHKTEHHGRARVVYLGPQAQAVLRPWLRPDLTAFLFSPREAMEERSAVRRRNRQTPLTPSQRDRKRKAKPKRSPRDSYDTRSYYHAIRYGCDRAGVPTWHPNQLRHNAATRLRKEFGLDTARAVLGHSSPIVTEVYAELDGAKAAKAMERVG